MYDRATFRVSGCVSECLGLYIWLKISQSYDMKEMLTVYNLMYLLRLQDEFPQFFYPHAAVLHWDNLMGRASPCRLAGQSIYTVTCTDQPVVTLPLDAAWWARKLQLSPLKSQLWPDTGLNLDLLLLEVNLIFGDETRLVGLGNLRASQKCRLYSVPTYWHAENKFLCAPDTGQFKHDGFIFKIKFSAYTCILITI